MFNNTKDKKLIEELSNSNNNIGKGTRIEGDIVSYGNIRIDGEVTGNITSKSKVVLGDSAKVNGNIVSQNAEIGGEVKGTIEIAEVLILKPTAIVHADVQTNKLVVESGAIVNGSCKMGAVIKEIQIEEESRTQSTERTA